MTAELAFKLHQSFHFFSPTFGRNNIPEKRGRKKHCIYKSVKTTNCKFGNYLARNLACVPFFKKKRKKINNKKKLPKNSKRNRKEWKLVVLAALINLATRQTMRLDLLYWQVGQTSSTRQSQRRIFPVLQYISGTIRDQRQL